MVEPSTLIAFAQGLDTLLIPIRQLKFAYVGLLDYDRILQGMGDLHIGRVIRIRKDSNAN